MSGLSTGDELKQADSWLQRNFVQAANAAAPTRLPLSGVRGLAGAVD